MLNLKKFFTISKTDAAEALKADAAVLALMNGAAAEKLDEAEKIPDAGERHLALTEIENLVEGNLTAAGDEKYRKIEALFSKPRRHMSALAGAAMGVAGIVAVVAAMTVVPLAAAATGLSLFFGGVLTGIGGGALCIIAGTSSSPGRHAKPFDDLHHQFEDTACAIWQKAHDMKQAIVRDELPGLAASKQFDRLYDSVPEIRNAFVRAAVRAGLEAGLLSAKPAAVPAAPKPV